MTLSYPPSSQMPHVTSLDVSIVRISGNESEKFLQGQLTCDLQKISNTTGSLGAYCTHQGKVLATFFICQSDEDYFIILPSTMSKIFIAQLSKYAVFSKVKVEDVSSIFKCVGIWEPNLESAPLKSSAHTKSLFNFSPSRYLYITTPEASDSWKKEDFFDEDPYFWKALNILQGIASIYPETSNKVTPHMINYHELEAISFNKGCYVGQEIIARTHYLGKSKRHLYLGEIENSHCPVPGASIQMKSQEIGMVVEACVTKEDRSLLLCVLQEHADLSELYSQNSEHKISNLKRF